MGHFNGVSKTSAPSLTLSLVLALGLSLMLSSCDQGAENLSPDHDKVSASTIEASATILSNNNTAMDKWARSCALCHVSGVGGAPITGNAEDWKPRLAKGQAVLLEHTIEGFNNMPPLGYCMSCERAEFVELITFMSGSAQ